jgi:hypothetical protein
MPNPNETTQLEEKVMELFGFPSFQGYHIDSFKKNLLFLKEDLVSLRSCLEKSADRLTLVPLREELLRFSVPVKEPKGHFGDYEFN